MGVVEHHAPPDSTLGLLQRGRGIGYLQALALPREEARKLLIECLTRDPRLDRQTEERAGYYAGLAIELGLDLAPLARHLRDSDGKDDRLTGLAIDTLAALARRGNAAAMDVLCDYVSWGEWEFWNLCDWPLDDFAGTPAPNVAARLARAVEQRFRSDDELAEKLAWVDLARPEVWAKIARHSNRIANLAGREYRTGGQAVSRPSREVPNASGWGAPEILAQTNEHNFRSLREAMALAARPGDLDLLMANVSVEKPHAASVALAGLEKLAPSHIFNWLLDRSTMHPPRIRWLSHHVLLVILALPAEVTLPYARQHLDDATLREQWLAERIMEKQATLVEVPLLRASLQRAMAEEEEHYYRICRLTEAFFRLPNAGPIPELLGVFSGFHGSYGRKLAARAIQITAPDVFAELFAEECLWDCESETQMIGTGSVCLNSARVMDRLHFLAADTWTEAETKAAAARRLGIN